MAFLQDLKNVLFNFKSKRTGFQAIVFFVEYTFFLLILLALLIPAFMSSFKGQQDSFNQALMFVRVFYSSVISITIFLKKRNYGAGSIITLLFAIFAPIILGPVICMLPASILTTFEPKE